MDEKTDDDSSIVVLRPKKFFGLTGPIQDSISYISDTRILYSVGHHVVLYDTESKATDFFDNTSSVRKIHALTVSSGCDFVAIAERIYSSSGLTSCISVYSVRTKARAKTMTVPSNNDVISLSFSIDSKLLMTLENNSTLSCWKWSNAKCLASTVCPSGGSRIRVCPVDKSIITVSGHRCLRIWSFTEMDLKAGQLLPNTKELEHFVDHIWTLKHLIAVTETGLVYIFSQTGGALSIEMTHVSLNCPLDEGIRVSSLNIYRRGFVLGANEGVLCLYDASDDPAEPYSLIRSFSIGQDTTIDCVVSYPDSDNVLICTKELSVLTLSVTKPSDECLSVLGGNHHGKVLGISTCIQRHIVASCSSNQTIRLWNYKTMECELLFRTLEEPTCVALHPTGFQLLVGGNERLRLYSVMHDELRLLQELSVKHCVDVKYAHGGQYFACAAGINVIVYTSYTCDLLYTLSCHIAAVRRIVWSMDDSILYSAGHDGCITQWNISTGTRNEQQYHILKQCKYQAVVIEQKDPNHIVVAGTDGKIRQLQYGEVTNEFEIGIPNVFITDLALSFDQKYLFAASNIGTILLYKWPLADVHIAEYGVHSDSISNLLVTFSGDCLLSSSEDGSIGIFYPTTSVIHDGISNEAVLIVREDIEELKTTLLDMQMKYEQIKSDNEYALHRQETEWIERLRLAKEEGEKLAIVERRRHDDLQHRYEQMIRSHADEIGQKDEGHVSITQELENQYEHKLSAEMSRYDALAEEMEGMRQRCETLLETQEKHHVGLLTQERKVFEQTITSQTSTIRELNQDLKYNEIKFEEILTQQESEYEMELKKVKEQSEVALEEERENTSLKEGQLTSLINKYEALKKKMQEMKANAYSRDVLLATEKEKVTKLQETVLHFEKHIDEREVTLADKEKNILRLRASNRTLDNFRFVLDHRVQQLQTEKGPIQHHVKQMEELIRDMHEELMQEFQRKTQIQGDLASKDLKIRFLSNEVKTLRHKTRETEHSMSQLTRELSRIVQLNHPKDIEEATRSLYHVYVKGEAQSNEQLNEEGQVVTEATRQVEGMHKALDSLKATFKSHKIDAEKQKRTFVSQNSVLISECNDLRKENRQLKMELEKANNNRPISRAMSKTRSQTPFLQRKRLLHTSASTSRIYDSTATQRTVSTASRLIPLRKEAFHQPRIIKGSTVSYGKMAAGEFVSEKQEMEDQYSDRILKQKQEIQTLRGQLNDIIDPKY